ncbi:hypothetical protein [Paracoccus sp. SMMA_5]|uniref:hypothetical protein n=1 Tax=Paracoccus sp. SMMA_5 TaxID=2654281 RepID=UPI0021E2B6C3|nr:hypothetical protein [Paracoccus sp. SMMA_5]UXU74329.1 hypothetical protein GB879_010510 [Paracoccus sp. SMMA_5]
MWEKSGMIGWRHRGMFTAPPDAFIPFCNTQKETILMKPVREKALAAICRRNNTHPQFCGWETPDRDSLVAAMNTFLAELPNDQPDTLRFVGAAEEALIAQVLTRIAIAGSIDILKAMSVETIANLRAVLRTSKEHIEIMSAHHPHWPQVPRGLSDWDAALFVLVSEAIHT